MGYGTNQELTAHRVAPRDSGPAPLGGDPTGAAKDPHLRHRGSTQTQTHKPTAT